VSKDKTFRPKARLPRGFRDRSSLEIIQERGMLDAIRHVYENYGFEALETPIVEYADALGKFLPDQDRPNEGVFSFKDDDGQWLSLRYDLTAPLARYVAENQQKLPRPFRRYQIGTNFRNEKPGPGRFREFTQCDADTVGTTAPSADAEMLMMFADTLEAVGLKRGDYAIKLSSRRLLDVLLESAEVGAGDGKTRGIVLRAIDKLDRLGVRGVEALLGDGRKDESGDFTHGAKLSKPAIDAILRFVSAPPLDLPSWWQSVVPGQKSADATAALEELDEILKLVRQCGYEDRVRFDPGIVRGLDYYTSVVFEAQLAMPTRNNAGEDVIMGSVGGGGRYDDLVARFTGQPVPAVGFSIGVSRLAAALRAADEGSSPLVVVLTLDKNDVASSFRIAAELRAAGIRAEPYVGEGGMKAQLKYADRRGASVAVIEGDDERARGEVTLKDLARGAERAKSVESRADWIGERAAQTSTKRETLIEGVRAILGRKA